MQWVLLFGIDLTNLLSSLHFQSGMFPPVYICMRFPCIFFVFCGMVVDKNIPYVMLYFKYSITYNLIAMQKHALQNCGFLLTKICHKNSYFLYWTFWKCALSVLFFIIFYWKQDWFPNLLYLFVETKLLMIKIFLTWVELPQMVAETISPRIVGSFQIYALFTRQSLLYRMLPCRNICPVVSTLWTSVSTLSLKMYSNSSNLKKKLRTKNVWSYIVPTWSQYPQLYCLCLILDYIFYGFI